MALEEINLIWLEGLDCAGCTISVKQASNPTLIDVLTGAIPGLGGLNLVFHQTLMFDWGEDATKVLIDAMEGKYDPFVLILEGAIPDEERANPGSYCVIGEYDGKTLTINEAIDGLSKKCAAAVSVGTCASFGGVPHGKPNPTGAKGLLDYLGKDWKGGLGLPVICIPGCPPRPDNIIQVLGHAVLAARGLAPLPELDEWHRPVYLYGNTSHENCSIAGLFAGGVASHDFGERGCLGLVGCKGLVARCNAPSMWVDGYGGCTRTGAPCIACADPNFPDSPTSPFFAEAPAMAYATDFIHGLWGHMRFALAPLKRRKI